MSKILAKLKKLFSFKDLINEDISFAFNEKFSNFEYYENEISKAVNDFKEFLDIWLG